jgi:hypothetical protein
MRTILVAVLAASTCWLVQAQSASCSSDGQTPPAALYERFTNADCADCWSQTPTAHAPGPSALVLDWIVPGNLGDEAPLSAAATQDALSRLKNLQRPVPAQSDTHVSTSPSPNPTITGQLRVAHGLPVNDYLGTSITWKPPSALRTASTPKAAPRPWQFYLLLVEAVPAGSEGTPVPRLLVRNVLEGPWDPASSNSPAPRMPWQEMRPMRIPDGAQAERLRIVGWIEDDQGRTMAVAQSRCKDRP